MEIYASQFPFNPLSLRSLKHRETFQFWVLENIFTHKNEINGYKRLILPEKTRICRFGLVSAPELHVQLCHVWRPAAPRTRRSSGSCSEVSLQEGTMRARRGRRCLRPLQLWKGPHQCGTAGPC